VRNGWALYYPETQKGVPDIYTCYSGMQRPTGSGDFPADLACRAMIRNSETIERERAGWDGSLDGLGVAYRKEWQVANN
jgi:hypothetical protein